jgi:uncharacterized cupin superfamily protein
MLTKLNPNGPSGLVPCAVVPAEALDGTAAPTEQGAVVFSEGGHTGGIWEATPYAERMENYPFNEMAHVLSGRVTITPDGAGPMTFGAGDSYFMQKGFKGRFEVTETLRKYYFVAE